MFTLADYNVPASARRGSRFAIRGFAIRDSAIRGFSDSPIRRFGDSAIRGFGDSPIRRFTDSMIRD
jgi:hypothetical protein